MTRVLFVCSQNRLRSPTAEAVFGDRPDLECASAGTNHDAEQPLCDELVAWADLIFVMEKTHLAKLRAKYARHLGRARVVCLDIPDNYACMDPELIRILHTEVTPHLNKAHRR